jgi:hypothetical protein
MNVSFLASDLGKWDAAEGVPETLVLPFFADERPLRGAAGLCDWRLCGRLSRMLQSSRVAGKWGETTLYPPGKRLPWGRLLLVGLGAADRFDEKAAREASRVIAEKMTKLSTPRYALVPPGRSTGRLSARRALEIYLEEARAAHASGELVVVESVAGQKEAAELTRSH